MRWARRNAPAFAHPVGKAGADYLCRLDDLRLWARNCPRSGVQKRER
ncbi:MULTISPECIES: hypothetical protein [Streptomyces]|uniref:Uncharacterized protein n=1 Tax=Streptomyces nymphaeiformis TaxID=2663842 RepID=A0A7W7U7Y6_9ACTN|nr:hypothetical protein [Streptomyces nymphaeiformis]MBB4986579.1 hypothetical protein [Streptomyces nymphaeiformis]